MKKLLFIEANTTGTGMMAIQKAHSLNVFPVFITRDPSIYKGLEEQECELMICDTNHYEEILAAIKDAFHSGEIGGITTTSEFYIHTVARLTSALGLTGNPPEAVAAARNKFAVREKLKQSKTLYQPFYAGVKNEEDLVKKRHEFPTPCIVKPVDDSGSNGVKVCHDFSDLLNHSRRLLKVKLNTRNQPVVNMVLVEEYVEGQEYSVECFSFNGKHTLIGITKKQVGSDPFRVEQGHLFPADDLSSDVHDCLEEGALEILHTLGWFTGPSHIEVKVAEGRLFLVEFNGRLAGGMIPELIRLSKGIDLLEEQIKASLGIHPELHHPSGCYAGIQFIVPGTSGVVTEINPIKDQHVKGIKKTRLNVQIGDEVEAARNAYGRIGHTIAVGEDAKQVWSVLQETSKQVKIEEKEYSR